MTFQHLRWALYVALCRSDDLLDLKPSLHIAPLKGWLNDPNGCYFDGARYHVFFQYNPNATTSWLPPMSWGHASSDDLLFWRREATLFNEAHRPWYEVPYGSWSGSIGPVAGTHLLVYSCVSNKLSALCAARRKKGDWIRLEHNPILSSTLTHWRDPSRIFTMSSSTNETPQFYTALGAERGTVALVRVRRGRANKWKFSHAAPLWIMPISQPEPIECPDFFRLPGSIDLWVLKISFRRKDFVIVGKLEFNGRHFMPCDPDQLYARHGTCEPLKRRRGEVHDAKLPAGARVDATRPNHRCVTPRRQWEVLTGAIVLDCGRTTYASKTLILEDGVVSFSWLPDDPSAVSSYNGALTLPRLITWEDGRVRYTFFHLRHLHRFALRCGHAECRLDGSNRVHLEFQLPTTAIAVLQLRATKKQVLPATMDCSDVFQKYRTCDLIIGDRVCAMRLVATDALAVSVNLVVDGSMLEWDLADGASACSHRWYRRDAPLAGFTVSVAAASHEVVNTSASLLLRAWQLVPSVWLDDSQRQFNVSQPQGAA